MRIFTTRRCILMGALAVLLAPRCSKATTYTWADTGTAWGTAGNWTPGGGPPNSLTADTAVFPSDATVTNQPTIGASSFSVLGITIDDGAAGAGGDYSLSGTTGVLTIGANGLSLTGLGTSATSSSANIAIAAAQTWTMDTADTFTQTGGFSGAYELTKDGAGTLIISSANTTPNMFVGGYSVSAGTLQAGTSASLAAQNLRSNPISLASGTSLTSGSTTITAGELSGAGTVSGSNVTLRILAVKDSEFSGAVSLGGTSHLNVRGGTGAIQTFSGNGTGMTGNDTATISSGVTLRLTGTGNSTSGVLGSNSSNGLDFTMRGGKLLLDNLGGNTSATNGRLNNTDLFIFLGGTFALTGSSAGSFEAVAGLTMNAGAATVQVTNTAGGTGAQLTFASFTRGSGLAGTINFVGDGSGTLGSAGDNPRVVFTSAPGTTNSVIANSGGSGILGFATVNGTDFAGYGANGVVAVSTTTVSGALASATTQNSLLNGNASVAGTNVVYNTLKIAPTASGQSLDLTGAGNLNTAGILLAGTTDYIIQNTGGGTGGIIAGNQRFVTVSDPNTTLNVATSMVSGSNALTKSGEGFLALTGSATQVGGGIIGIAAGVLRSSLTSLGGGTSAGGANSTIQLRGGVLEISGGGTLSRSLDELGNGSGGGMTFDEGATDQGAGGFSAVGGNATVTFVTSRGGSTPSSPTSSRSTVWGGGNFVPDGHGLLFGSSKSDSSITLSNDFALDADTATSGYNAREIRVADNTGSSTDKAILSGQISGSAYGDLLKTGPGTLELSFATGNTYKGNTLVVGGKLIVSNTSGSGTGTGLVKVSIDGTLGGNGLITGPVVADSGGKISPGESIANLGVGNLTFNTGSTMVYEIDTSVSASVGADLLNGLGELNIGTGVTLSFDDIALLSSPLTPGTKFTLIRYSNGKWNGGTFSGVANGSQVPIEATTFVINYQDTSGGSNFGGGTAGGSYVTLTAVAVPEPGAFLFGAVVCGLAGAAYGRRPFAKLRLRG